MSRLAEIAREENASKETVHHYCSLYEPHFNRIGPVKSVLEIGVDTGASLRTWRRYWPDARVVGMDLQGCPHPEDVEFVRGDQANRKTLRLFFKDQDFDIILDDGGHTMEQQQISAVTLIHHVRPGGLYVIEDLQTSFRKQWGGGNHNSTIAFLMGSNTKHVTPEEAGNFRRHVQKIHWIEAEHHGLSAILDVK